jgi:DNA adenine methylase
MTTKLNVQKPFLKWVGGKTQIITHVMDKFPKEINNYHELFLGGGSVLLALLSLQKEGSIKITGKVYAYDVNSILIQVYKNIQSNKDDVFKYIEKYITEYDKLDGKIEVNRKPKNITEAKTSKESYYYWLRSKFNSIDKSTIEASALFIIINKLCFRGVYREGPNGFNVPYGHYKKTPTVITKEDLYNISELIKDVEFKQCSFEESIKNIGPTDFVYLDPPYAPENAKSFVGYVADGFNLEMHNKLFTEIKNIDKQGTKFLMSNSKVKLVIDTFVDYNSEDISVRRAINSKNPSAKTTEILIYN